VTSPALASRLLALCLVVTASTTAIVARAEPDAARPRAQPAAAGARAVRFSLANGLDVILEPVRRQSEVAVLIGYDVGLRDDPPGYSELSHLVEHMTFRGSRHLPFSYDGMLALKKVGARQLNVRTSFDSTQYQIVVPSAHLETALWIESERMAFTLERFDERSLLLEKETLASETRRRGLADVQGNFLRLAQRAAFGAGHPYGRARRANEFERIELSDVQWFFQASYRPKRAHLVIVGDFDEARARAAVERYFGPIVNPGVDWPREPLPAFTRVAHGEVVLHTKQPVSEQFIHVFAGPPAFSRDAAAFEILKRALYRRLRDRLEKTPELARGVSCHWHSLAAGSLFELGVQVPAGETYYGVEQAMTGALRSIWTVDWDEYLQDARRRAALDAMRDIEQPIDRARAHLESVIARGRPYDLGEQLELIRSLTSADFANLSRYFSDDRRLAGRLVRIDENDVVTSDGAEIIQ
jgi:predicted Zn-dependent peptidase